ncbi:hypothetical protein [Helicobacter burdigaliensis]|uniref:hypothetical protein n=1 Tax=Helicobacter burdigaliensis TaxID=2315334 RepID=UPI000EF74723|nr:hypothetical protein [Helicobacter burdigaliensis]
MKKSLYTAKDPYGFVCEAQARDNQEYDYEILRITTHTRRKNDISSYSYGELSHFNNGTEFLSRDEIYQIFEINIVEKTPKAFFWKLLLDDEAVELEATLELGDNCVYHQDIKDELTYELYKEMLKEGLLVGIRMLPKFFEQLEEIITQIKTQEFPSSVTFKVAKGVRGEKSQKDVLELRHPVFETTNHEMYYEKPIQKDSLLFYYKKGVPGKRGRNLRGEILEEGVKDIHQSVPKILGGIYIKQTQEGYYAYAEQYGYLFRSKNEFGVFNEIKLKEVSLKTTGNLQANLQEDVSLQVKNVDKLQDSIGESVELSVNNIQVKGNVGKSSIVANTIDVQGQTHLKTNIIAHHATLSNLKGSIEGEVVCVDSLENGKIKAKIAIINQCMGGKIIADKIYIKNLKSYNEIYPQGMLVVDTISGDMNLIEVGIKRTDKEENAVILSQNISELRSKLKYLLLKMEQSYSYVSKNQVNIYVIKNSLKGQSVSANIQSILEKYEKVLVQYHKMLKEYQDIVRLLFYLEEKEQNIANAILEIECMILGKSLGRDNLLRYRLNNADQKEIRYMLDGTEFKHFQLVKTENENFRLKKNEDYNHNKISWIHQYSF